MSISKLTIKLFLHQQTIKKIDILKCLKVKMFEL